MTARSRPGAARPKPVQTGLLLPGPPPGYDGITVAWEIHGPEALARALVRRLCKGLMNEPERKFSASLDDQVLHGLCGPNGETFVFSTDGHLIGGRKVAMAAVRTGRRILRLTVRGVAPEAMFLLGDYVPKGRDIDRAGVPAHPDDPSLDDCLARLRSGSPGTPYAALTMLTPAMAQTLRPEGKAFDKLKSSRVVRLMARDAKTYRDDASRFLATGESIKVDRNGKVMDGNKRIVAVILSGCPIPVVLVTGLDPAWAGTYDRGLRVNRGGRLNWEDVSNPWGTASTIQMYDWLFLDGSERRLGYSNARFRDVYDANAWLNHSNRLTRPVEDFVRQKVSIVLHRAFELQNPDRVQGFFDEIARSLRPGEEGTEDWVLRLRALVDGATAKGTPLEVQNLKVMNYLIQAWDAYVAGIPPTFRASTRKPLLDLG